MKKSLLLLITIAITTYSCSISAPESALVGEYEFIDETDGKLYEAEIVSNDTGPFALSWIGPGVGRVPITESSGLTFRISTFEIWGFLNTLKGELKGKELHVTQEVFELEDIDLETPVLISNRLYIKK